MADKKRKAAIIAAVILGCAALLYLGGMLGQLNGGGVYRRTFTYIHKGGQYHEWHGL